MTSEERSSEVQRALLSEAVERHGKEIDSLREMVETRYVTKDQFEPVRMVAYGAVSILLGSLLIAIIGLVVTKQ